MKKYHGFALVTLFCLTLISANTLVADDCANIGIDSSSRCGPNPNEGVREDLIGCVSIDFPSECGGYVLTGKSMDFSKTSARRCAQVNVLNPFDLTDCYTYSAVRLGSLSWHMSRL